MEGKKRLVQDFLIPALDSRKYGEYLEWVDHEQKIFRLLWNHKNGADWNENDAVVFVEWDKLKNRYKPGDVAYFMQSKQRFRAALHKLDNIREIKMGQKKIRVYQIVDGKSDEKKKRAREILGRSKKIIKKEVNQRSIPTSVIRKNTSYIAKQSEEDSMHSSHPSSPGNSPGSNMSEADLKEEMDKCYREHMAYQMRDYLLHNTTKVMHHERETSPSISENVHGSSGLPKNTVTRDTPLLAEQSNLMFSPEYSESPDFFVAPTHYKWAVKVVGCQ
ncbi:IRF tryptophan pentad repeat domain-containing protein [Nephila pilipes]|uniref:IRF tryptophan pentad repeat domain-containing protein n=1 Tax=Nephila pilipes TaxID=299642 RepID=A0A8X6UIJ4_NEPPI|nr:IRF tryptophan pentad repeat domain-containing protein [Nephila pilipes]